MKLQKLIRRQIRHDGEETQVVGDVNAAISANVNERGPSHTHVSSRQRIVQRSGGQSAPEREETTGEANEPTSG